MAGKVWADHAAFEDRAARDDISGSAIHFSRLTGMAPADIEHLQMFTINEALLIVIRCPKRSARFHHGRAQAKPMWMKRKSDEDGLVTFADGRKPMVSDYDLMSVYRYVGRNDYEKIPFSGIDPNDPRSALRREATLILQKVNRDLLSRFQHGAQDDFSGAIDSETGRMSHPNVKTADRFIAFNVGSTHYLPTMTAAEAFYRKYGLAWPYDGSGKHVSLA